MAIASSSMRSIVNCAQALLDLPGVRIVARALQHLEKNEIAHHDVEIIR